MEAKTIFTLNGQRVTVSAWVCIDGTRCVGVLPEPHGATAEVMYADTAHEQGNLYHRMCAVVECLGGKREA
jgi:hypothetical protein